MSITKNIIALALACSLGTGIAWGQGKRTAAELAELVQQGQSSYVPAYAQCLLSGDGTEVDAGKALELLEKSVQENNPEGKFVLGIAYMMGLKELNLTKALNLFEEASAGGIVSATSYLGFFYDHGLGTKSNLYKAVEQYVHAAPRDVAARCSLALMYGDRTPFPDARAMGQNVNEALGSFKRYDGAPYMLPNVYEFLLHERSQSRGLVINKLYEPRPPKEKLSALELYNWGMLYQLAVEMGTDIGAMGVRQSRELLEESARRDFVLAKIALAAGKAEGGSAEGLAELRKYADQGYLFAKIDLLSYYRARLNNSRQIAEGYVNVLEDLAKIGLNPAYEMLAKYYATQSRDGSKAWEYTLKAADAGNAASCYKAADGYRTGQCPFAGVNISKDPALAFKYLSYLCKELPNGDYSKLDMCRAFTQLGNMYTYGIGTKADLNEAIDMYQDALDTPRGDKEEATYRLASQLVKSPEKRTIGLEMLRQVSVGASEFAVGARATLKRYGQ